MYRVENLKSFGEDVYISHHVEIKRPNLMEVGSHVSIDFGFYCTTKFKVGSYVHVGPYVTCIGGSDGEFESTGFNNIMAGARIICSSDRFDESGLFGSMIPVTLRGRRINKKVVMEEFSNIGTNSIILPGSTLRKGAFLTAGSLLMGDTEEWGVYKGNPAKIVKVLNGEKIIESAKILGYK